MPADKTIDFVVMFLTIGLLVLGLGSVALGWLVRQYDRFMARFAAEPEPSGSAAFPLLNGDEPDEPRSLNPAELLLNAAEIAAIHRMIEHNKTAAKPSKSSSIQAGFGVARGGSAAYTRASELYDALFGPVAPAIKYRPLTPDHRTELGVGKH